MLVLATFITPPYTGAVGWILLAGPNAGWLNRFLHVRHRRRSGPVQHLQLHRPGRRHRALFVSYIFIFTTAALNWCRRRWRTPPTSWGRHVGPCGGSPLPALPAILGGLIISFLEAIALFGAPALIALPARFNVVTTQLWQFFEYPVRVEVAAAYAMPLLGITVLLFLAAAPHHPPQGLRLAHRQGRRTPADPARHWRWAMLAAMFVATLSVFLPYLFLRRRPSPRPGAAASRSTTSRCAISTTCCSSTHRGPAR